MISTCEWSIDLLDGSGQSLIDRLGRVHLGEEVGEQPQEDGHVRSDELGQVRVAQRTQQRLRLGAPRRRTLVPARDAKHAFHRSEAPETRERGSGSTPSRLDGSFRAIKPVAVAI